MVRKIKIDQQRNVLYCLKEVTEGVKKGQLVLQAWDLDTLGDKTRNFASIKQNDLCKAIFKLRGLIVDD